MLKDYDGRAEFIDETHVKYILLSTSILTTFACMDLHAGKHS